MNLYLAEFTMVTTYNPGDDGMRTVETPNRVRLVWADTEEDAKEKLINAVERYKAYEISVEVRDLEITPAYR